MTATHALVIKPLDRRHDRTASSCGLPELNRHLNRQAGQDVCHLRLDRHCWARATDPCSARERRAAPAHQRASALLRTGSPSSRGCPRSSSSRRRYRNGLFTRRPAEDSAPLRMFEDIVRAIAREPTGRRCHPLPSHQPLRQTLPRTDSKANHFRYIEIYRLNNMNWSLEQG